MEGAPNLPLNPRQSFLSHFGLQLLRADEPEAPVDGSGGLDITVDVVRIAAERSS
jgi:hypothetical protein